MDHLRYALGLNRAGANISPDVAARVALLEKHSLAIKGMVIRHVMRKHIARSERNIEILTGQAAVEIYLAVSARQYDLATFEAWAMSAEESQDNGIELPPPVQAVDDCMVVALDRFAVQGIYAAVLCGAGQVCRLRFDALGDPVFDADLLLSPQIMLNQLYRACIWRTALPYIRWPAIAACEDVGRIWKGAPVHLLPSAVAAALLPLVKVS